MCSLADAPCTCTLVLASHPSARIACHRSVGFTLRSVAIAVVVFLSAGYASAQTANPESLGDRRSSMLLGAVLLVQAPAPDCEVSCGLPGQGYGAVFSVTRWTTGRIGVGAELVVGPHLSGRQQVVVTGGRVESRTDYHETSLFATVRLATHYPPQAAAAVILVPGIGLAKRSANRRGPFRTYFDFPVR